MDRRLICAILTLPLLASGRSAHAQHMNNPAAPCRDKVATVEIYDCFDVAGKVADKKLNQTYSEILAKLSPDEQRALRDAERLWVQFRDATCAAERALYGRGTAAGPAYVACLEEETRQRESDLLSIYGWRLKK